MDMESKQKQAREQTREQAHKLAVERLGAVLSEYEKSDETVRTFIKNPIFLELKGLVSVYEFEEINKNVMEALKKGPPPALPKRDSSLAKQEPDPLIVSPVPPVPAPRGPKKEKNIDNVVPPELPPEARQKPVPATRKDTANTKKEPVLIKRADSAPVPSTRKGSMNDLEKPVAAPRKRDTDASKTPVLVNRTGSAPVAAPREKDTKVAPKTTPRPRPPNK